jgi:predicted Zn-dependent protease
MRRPLAAAAGAAAPVLGIALALLRVAPAAAQRVSNPEIFGKSLAAAEQALDHYGQWDDDEARRRVNDIGYRVAAASRFDRYPFSFYLVDMREPNAFALPGGHIFVTRGMIELGLDDDQLAALLGHEIAHVTLEHGLKLQRRATLLNVLSSAVLVGVILADKGGSDVPPGVPRYGAGAQASSGADRIQGAAAASLILSELLLRSHSREFEDQADEEGQRMASAAGFAPEGGARLFSLMSARLPQSKEYGYWRTHPFFDTRVGAAEARGRLLEAQPPQPADGFRKATQDALLAFEPKPQPGDGQPPEAAGQRREPMARPDKAEAQRLLIADTALAAWPAGPTAERLRLEALHRLRDAEMDDPELERDFGSIVRGYEEQMAEVQTLTPESPFLSAAESEARGLRETAAALLPRAREVVAEGVYQTEFLETYLSNYPQAPDRPRLTYELAGAYARQGKQAEAVERYREALHADPDGPVGERALAGLRALATVVTELSALQQLAYEVADSELQKVTTARLAQLSSSYEELANGADYLRRFPDGPVAPQVATRLEQLADELYGEVVLYRGVGDAMKALERIQQILTHAPLTPAAERLRERAVLEG